MKRLRADKLIILITAFAVDSILRLLSFISYLGSINSNIIFLEVSLYCIIPAFLLSLFIQQDDFGHRKNRTILAFAFFLYILITLLLSLIIYGIDLISILRAIKMLLYGVLLLIFALRKKEDNKKWVIIPLVLELGQGVIIAINQINIYGLFNIWDLLYLIVGGMLSIIEYTIVFLPGDAAGKKKSKNSKYTYLEMYRRNMTR